jgi:serine/threonine protein phosphatase PrpC
LLTVHKIHQRARTDEGVLTLTGTGDRVVLLTALATEDQREENPGASPIRDELLGLDAQVTSGLGLERSIEGVAPAKELMNSEGEDREAGDRIALVTDGVLERNAATLEIAALLADTAGRHPREVVYTIGDEVLRATGGDLRDDATIVCIDWHGGPVRGRLATPLDGTS